MGGRITSYNVCYTKLLRSSLYHEIQHAIQGIEGFAKGARKEQVGGREQYRKVAGEAESRNVQNRIA